MKELFKALANFQEEVPVIHEDTKGYNYTYSNINTIFGVIKPLLKKHGLGFYQSLQGDRLDTVLFHVDTGHEIHSTVDIPRVKLGSMNEYQSLGSGITYLRRYSLSCLLGLITDKDIDAKSEEPTKEVPVLSDENFEKALNCDKKQIESILKRYKMSDEKRKQLNSKL